MIWFTLLGVASIAVVALLTQRSRSERVYATFEWPSVPAVATPDDSVEIEPIPPDPTDFALVAEPFEPHTPAAPVGSELIPSSPDVDMASVLITEGTTTEQRPVALPKAPKKDMISTLIPNKPKVDMASMFKPASPGSNSSTEFIPSIPEEHFVLDDELEMDSPFQPPTDEAELASSGSSSIDESEMGSPFLPPTDESDMAPNLRTASDAHDSLLSNIDLGWMEPAFDTGDYDALIPRDIDDLADVRLPRGLRPVPELGYDPYGMWFAAVDRQRRDVTVLRFAEEWANTPESFLHLKTAIKRAAHLRHSNIAQVRWGEKNHGRVLLMGQYVVGRTLADRLARTNPGLTLIEVFDLAETLLSTLAFAHRRGVLHRDLRPRDVVYTAPGTIVLTHFGLERALNRGFGPFGDHVAPEERAGKGVDQRSDLFSLAWLIRRCLTAQTDIDSPPRLEELLDRALSEDKLARPATAKDMLQSIRAIRRSVVRSRATESPLENLESLSAVFTNSNPEVRIDVLQSAIEQDIGRFIELTQDFLLQPEVDLETRTILFGTLADLMPVQALPTLGAVVYHFNTRLAGLPTPDVPLRLIAEARALDAVLVEFGGERVERLRAVLKSAFGHLLVGPMPEEPAAESAAVEAEPEAENIDDTLESPHELEEGETEAVAQETTENVQRSSMVFTLASEPPPTDESGRYQFTHRMRTNPVADLYLARRDAWSQSVLVRVLKNDSFDEEALARFHLEGRKIKQLHDISINPLFELGTFSGRPFVAEEFVDGHTLAEEIQHNEHGLPFEQVLAMGRALTAALEYVHDNGVFHRDIAPENVLLVAGRIWRLAHFAFETWTSHLTGLGSSNIWYAAPEVIAGEPIDAKADVFGLGATLYEALCGQRPFEGDDRRSPVVPLRKHRESIPQALAHVVHQCLSLDSAQRPSVSLLAKQLRAVEERFDTTWSQEVPAVSSMGSNTPMPPGSWGANPPIVRNETPNSGVLILDIDDEPTREFVEATREYQDTTREYQDALFDALKDEMSEDELAQFVKVLKRL